MAGSLQGALWHGACLQEMSAVGNDLAVTPSSRFLSLRLDTMPATLDSLDDVAKRIRAEYREMPGLNLTARQAARLWSLDQATSQSLLESLAEVGFLSRAQSGTYVLLDRRSS